MIFTHLGDVLSLLKLDSLASNLKKASHWRLAMRCFFLLYLVTFTLDPFFRDFFSVLCLASLLGFHFFGYKDSCLRLFDGKVYFVFYYAFMICGVLFSQNISESFNVVLLHSFTSFTLPFVAMECVRNLRELKQIVWALVFALIIQGLIGVHQYFTGYDIIHNTPTVVGRLTGSFSDYRVGNYIALTLIPACAVFLILRPTLKFASIFVTITLLAPSLFLMLFSYTRNAYITLAAAFLLGVILWRIISREILLAIFIFLLGFMRIAELRFNFNTIAQDARWVLWDLACDLFKVFPIFGAGIGQYTNTSIAMSDDPTAVSKIILSHPHNIYLQFLSENGIVGFCFIMIFLFGMLWWGYKKFKPLVQASKLTSKKQEGSLDSKLFWQIGTFFWCGWGAFLASGVFGHNFFQRWWQALVMAYLGIMIGIIVQATRKDGK